MSYMIWSFTLANLSPVWLETERSGELKLRLVGLRSFFIFYGQRFKADPGTTDITILLTVQLGCRLVYPVLQVGVSLP